jgi:hypothetical protein
MRTREGLELIGGSPEEIIADLHSKSFTQEVDDQTFMVEMQHRTLLQTGQHVRIDTATALIADLLKLGLLVDDDQEGKLDKPAKWQNLEKSECKPPCFSD